MSEANQYACMCLNECLQILFLIFLQTNLAKFGVLPQLITDNKPYLSAYRNHSGQSVVLRFPETFRLASRTEQRGTSIA
jgi:hypothetical protein